jgi:hypothetical protein
LHFEFLLKFTIRGLSLAFPCFSEEIGLKMMTFSGMQCSLIIRGFGIRGNLTELTYRELQGKPAP